MDISIILQVPFSKINKSDFENTSIRLIDIEDTKHKISEANEIKIKTLSYAIKMGKGTNANLIISSNITGNKFGVAIRKNQKESFTLLTPQQTAILILDSLSEEAFNKKEKLKKALIKSILLPELIESFATKRGLKTVNTLPGDENLHTEWKKNLDKEPVLAVDEFNSIILNPESHEKNIAEVVTILLKREKELASRNKNFLDRLIEIYCAYSFNKQKTYSIDIVDENKKKHFNSMLKNFRSKPPKVIADFKVKKVVDFEKKSSKNLITGRQTETKFPNANILSFTLDKGGKVMIMPIEDKIYFHISMDTKIIKKEQYSQENELATENMVKLIASLGNYRY